MTVAFLPTTAAAAPKPNAPPINSRILTPATSVSTATVPHPLPSIPPRFAKLLSRSLKSGNHNESLYFLEHIASKCGRLYHPDPLLCTRLIKFFLSARDADRALRVMRLLESSGAADAVAYGALLSGLSKLNNTAAIRVLDTMRDRGCSPDIVTYNTLLRDCCARRRLDLAMDIFRRITEDSACTPTPSTYTILVQATIEEHGVAKAVGLFSDMADSGVGPDTCTFAAIIRGLCAARMVEESRELLAALPSLADVISYNVVLRGILRRKQWRNAEALLDEMTDRGIDHNSMTYSALIAALCQEGLVDQAKDLIGEMGARGLQPTTCCYDPLIAAYCREGKLDAAIEFMDAMISSGCRPDIVNYNMILSGMCKSGRAEEALEAMERLEETGCSPNTSTYNAIIGGLWNSGDRAKALEMVTKMLERGINADTVTYNVLTSCLCRDGLVGQAVGLVRDMENAGIQPTAITYNTMILGFCKAGQVDAAIDVFAEMVAKGCRPNETTYVVLVEGIFYAGHRAAAAELAGELAAREVFSEAAIERLSRNLPSIHPSREAAPATTT